MRSPNQYITTPWTVKFVFANNSRWLVHFPQSTYWF